MLNKISLGLIVLLVSGPLLAQEASDQDKDRQWVTDQLRLSLYQNSNSSSQIIKYLSSGELLEIEQLSGAYAFVTLTDGTKGWVKRGFLVTKPTSNILLEEEKVKTKQLEAEIEKLNNSKVIIDQYEKDMDKLVEKLDVMETENQKATQSIGDLKQEIEAKELAERQKATNTVPVTTVLWNTFVNLWHVIIPILLGIMAMVYLVSKEITETRIKKKFHGIKVW